LREEPQTVVLGAAAQKDAAGAAIGRLIAAHKADALGVERFGTLDIVDKETDRADLSDLERPRQHYALDVVIRREGVLRAVAREDRDPLSLGLGHLRRLGHLRQRRLLL